MDINFTWSDPADDDLSQDTAKIFIHKAKKLARSRGLYHPYKYQNYAYITQDVFKGYGRKNKQRLLQIQQKYDPDFVFRDLQPGYFK